MTSAPFNPVLPINHAAIKSYLDCLFHAVDWADGGIISLLGVGEKGTDKEGKFRERKFVDPRSPFMISMIEGHLQRWAKHGIAAFIVPAVVHPEAEAANDVTLERIAALTAIVVDIDSGNTEAKLAYAVSHLHAPSMIVASGGTTETGHPKIHVYWVLSEPEDSVESVAALRKELAAKIGGDQAFGRATQVIRIPGSIYAKSGASKPVELKHQDGRVYHWGDIAEAIVDMPYMEGCEPVQLSAPLAQHPDAVVPEKHIGIAAPLCGQDHLHTGTHLHRVTL